MKLRHVIAGTVALPLALAVASANAAVVPTEKGKLNIGGYITGVVGWDKYDSTNSPNANNMDSDINTGIHLGLSRLNVSYTSESGVTLLYENDFAAGGVSGGGYRLRHAAVMADGFVVGQYWSAFSNLTALAETIDDVATTAGSTWAGRNAVLGKNFDLGDGMSVGLFIEDVDTKRTANTAIPDVVANFKGNFGDVNAFAAVRMVQKDDPTSTKQATEGKVDLTLGVSAKVSDQLTIKAGLTSYDDNNKRSAKDDGRDNFISVAAGFKIDDQNRAGLVVERFMPGSDDIEYTSVWANYFHVMDNGLDVGAEVQLTKAGDNALANGGAQTTSAKGAMGSNASDGDMSIRLRVKYAF